MCHLLPTPIVTATDPFPARSPIMQSRLVCQNRTHKPKSIKKSLHLLKNVYQLPIIIRKSEFVFKRKIIQNGRRKSMYCLTYHVSPVICHQSPFTCHLSLSLPFHKLGLLGGISLVVVTSAPMLYICCMYVVCCHLPVKFIL